MGQGKDHGIATKVVESTKHIGRFIKQPNTLIVSIHPVNVTKGIYVDDHVGDRIG